MSQPVYQEASLQELNDRFENAYPQDILRWTVETYGQKAVVVTSFQPTGIVTLHMLQDIAPDTPVLTLDTGLLFPETYALMDALEDRLHLNLHRIQPANSVAQQAQLYGDKLWETDPDRCCNMRKTLPLKNALTGYEAWFTGVRRDQSNTRAQTPVFAWDTRNAMLKVCPFATWTEEMVWTYIHAHDLPYNTLHDKGYPSIGCFTCTQAVPEGEDQRSGRWSNSSKTECGIHVMASAS